jgi:hypothetical protein
VSTANQQKYVTKKNNILWTEEIPLVAAYGKFYHLCAGNFVFLIPSGPVFRGKTIYCTIELLACAGSRTHFYLKCS